MARTLRPPDDLAADGRVFWRAVHRWLDSEGADFDPHETTLVAELCRIVDRQRVARDTLAMVDPSTPAWTRLDNSLRQNALAMGRLVSSLGLPTGLVDGAPEPGRTSVSRRQQKNAKARWQPRVAGG